MSRARVGLAGAVVSLAMLLAGCVGVPTSGRVEKVEGRQQTCQNCVNVEVSPPSPGDDPRQVVEGFLRANANYQSGYSVAKQYLTRESAQAWKPEDGVTVYDLDAITVEDDEVSLSGRTVGQIAADRSYSARDAAFSQTFSLVEQDGEWRIDAPPAGLLVAGFAFTRNYSTYDLYFPANGRPTDQRDAVQSPVLVPDPIWLPQFRNPGRVASALVKALLVGPTQWLAPAVTTAIPPGTTLSVDSVTITDGVASVALSDSVLALPDAQRSLLAAQIVYTLKDALAVRGVLITVNQQGFRVPESDPTTLVVPVDSISRQLDPISPLTGSQLYVVRDGAVGLVDPASSQVEPFDAGLGGRDVSALAVSVTGSDLAAVTDGGTALVEASTVGADTKARTVLSGVEGLARPQFTRFGELWALGSQGGSQQLWRVGDQPQVVSAPELDGRTITAFSISPDGVRVALLERTRSGSRLLVGRVGRGDRVELEGVREVDTAQTGSTQLRELKDVGWLDATHMLVLGAATSKEPAGPYAVSEDASTITDQGEVLDWDPVEVSVLLPTQSAIVRSKDGQTWRDQGTTWVSFVDDVRAVAYPG